jgi:hypothetical protein
MLGVEAVVLMRGFPVGGVADRNGRGVTRCGVQVELAVVK